jgi:dCMP deaminase
MREDWDTYFMNIAHQVATRSTCLHRKSGAIIVVNKNLVSTGYNGAPIGVDHCLSKGVCRKRDLGFGSGEGHQECLATHAEANAIIFAARQGTRIDGGTIYSTTRPCIHCAKLIINSGLKVIKYWLDYPDPLSQNILSQAGIQQVHLKRKLVVKNI